MDTDKILKLFYSIELPIQAAQGAEGPAEVLDLAELVWIHLAWRERFVLEIEHDPYGALIMSVSFDGRIELLASSGLSSICRCAESRPQHPNEDVAVLRDASVDHVLSIPAHSGHGVSFPSDEVKPAPEVPTPRQIQLADYVFQGRPFFREIAW